MTAERFTNSWSPDSHVIDSHWTRAVARSPSSRVPQFRSDIDGAVDLTANRDRDRDVRGRHVPNNPCIDWKRPVVGKRSLRVECGGTVRRTELVRALSRARHKRASSPHVVLIRSPLGCEHDAIFMVSDIDLRA
jgi:hypothetical protein